MLIGTLKRSETENQCFWQSVSLPCQIRHIVVIFLGSPSRIFGDFAILIDFGTHFGAFKERFASNGVDFRGFRAIPMISAPKDVIFHAPPQSVPYRARKRSERENHGFWQSVRYNVDFVIFS